MGVLPKGVLIGLRARNFVHAITSLRASCVYARHRARNFSRPDKPIMIHVLTQAFQ